MIFPNSMNSEVSSRGSRRAHIGMTGRLLIDTDVLIDYLRGQAEAVSYLEGLEEPLLPSAVTVAELYAGVREGKERAALEAFISAFEIVPLSEAIAKRGGLHRRDFNKEPQRGPRRRVDCRHRRAGAGNLGDAQQEALSDA
jgi:predicted nucleic acid-binding protein